MGKKSKKGKKSATATISSGSGWSPQKRTFSGAFGGQGSDNRPARKKVVNKPFNMKTNDRKETSVESGHDSPQTRSWPVSSSSNPIHSIKKPNSTPSQIRKTVNFNANTSSDKQTKPTTVQNFKKSHTGIQATSQLTAAQVFKKSNMSTKTDSSKQKKGDFNHINKTAATAANEFITQRKTESNQGKKSANLTSGSGLKPEKIHTTPIELKRKPDLSLGSDRNNLKVGAIPDKTEFLSQETVVLHNKTPDMPTTKTAVDTVSNMAPKAKSLMAPEAKAEESDTSRSESGSDSDSSDSEGSNNDQSEDDYGSKLKEIADSPSEDGSSGNKGKKFNKLATVTIHDAQLRDSGNGRGNDAKPPVTKAEIKFVPTPQPRTEEGNSLSRESGYEGDNDETPPNLETQVKIFSPLHPRIEEISSSCSGGPSDSESDEEQHASTTELKLGSSLQPSVGEVGNPSGNSGSKRSEGEEAGDHVDTRSKNTPLKQVLDIVSQKANPHQLTLDNLASHHLRATWEPFNEKFRETLIGPEFNLTARDVDELADKLRAQNVHVNISSNSAEATITDQFISNEDLVHSARVLPNWFSQKVKNILEKTNRPEYLNSKDINRLTHYRAWLERVRHRRWQQYNLADEKRTQLTSLLLRYKIEGRHMEAYTHRFLQRAQSKRDALRSFQRLRQLVEGIKLLDDTLNKIYAHVGMESMKLLSLQKRVDRCSGAPCF